MADEFKIDEAPKVDIIPESISASPAPSAATQPKTNEAPKRGVHFGKAAIIAIIVVAILALASVGILYSGILKQSQAQPTTVKTSATTTATTTATTSTIASSTTTSTIIQTRQVNFYVSVKDRNDTYRRYMRLFIDQPPGTYLGYGLYANSTNYGVIINNSVGTIGLPTLLQVGTHTAYLILSQSGGPSYGTYSGNVIVEDFPGGGVHVNATFNVSGITSVNSSSFTFNVV